ncbi:MAG: right-handed parallel beta-helix repeat-containing protein, partial [Paenibacillus sp.]|nr:right-handed parallel beta-helix repeat-containing protein [Paenibacillus sp.]
IDYLKQRTGKPLISTEWSQAHLLKPWLTQTINSGFAAAWGVSPTLTNEQYVKLLLATPASKAEWDAFVGTSPINESFLQEASTALLEKGMVATTYGAAKQYGAVMYDMKQLYATMTVQLDTYGQYQENGTYAQTFAGLDTTLPAKPFSEDFEYGLGQWAVDYGSPTISRSVAHTGSGSLLINEDQEQASHTWDAMNQKALSIWFYDDASDTSSRVRVHAGSTTNGYLASLGVDTPTSSTKYAYQLYTGSLNWKATTVTRTTGWHHLVFDYSGGAGVTLYMDGVQVAQSSAHQAFNKIMIGDTSIGTTSTAYFDDIEIIDP